MAAEARAGEEACLGGRRRVRLPAPLPDDERTPVLEALDEVLAAVTDPEPPMRNADGVVAEIRARRPWGLHGLTHAGADAEEAPENRLPPPEEPLITALDPVGLGLLVERHIEHYRTEKDRPERAVALPEPFLRSYLEWQGSRLPVLRAVVTAPLVTHRGELLAGAGLDRVREVVFRIPPALQALVPADPGAITEAEVLEALRFLVDEWLCDVATGFAGRVVLLAYALTIIERVLLPERPAFFVTAGLRGGGKTTVLIMLIMAVLGRRPPAAAWSPSAEERRKALLAYLAEGLATLVWDNIERGTAISCPHIEKALTAVEYTDRVLCASRSATVPSTTVLAFTGNNIAPKGDMASRSLVCRLEVDRPDPENRSFRHPDPVGWTVANRAPILRALYILLRWNPQVRVGPAERHPSKTRFKIWWDLVGAPLELAAMLACDAQAAAARRGGDGPFRCAPEPVDFGALFAAGEVEEEETAGMRELVLLLRDAFGDRLFSAADLAGLLHAPAAMASRPCHGDFAGRGRAAGGGRGGAGAGAAGGAGGRDRQGAAAGGGGHGALAWASACRWWWGARWRLVRARSGRWSRRTAATMPTPTAWRSRRKPVSDRARKCCSRPVAAPNHSPLSRLSLPGRESRGKWGVRRRPSRPARGHSPMSGAAFDPADLLRRLRARGGSGGMPAGFRGVDTAAARPRAAAEAQAEAPAADVGWPRERAETAPGHSPVSGAASDPADLLRRLRARGGSGGMPAGFRGVDTAAARLRAAAEAEAEAPAAPTWDGPGSARKPLSWPRGGTPRGPAWLRCSPMAPVCTAAAFAGASLRGASAWRSTAVARAFGFASSTGDAPDDGRHSQAVARVLRTCLGSGPMPGSATLWSSRTAAALAGRRCT